MFLPFPGVTRFIVTGTPFQRRQTASRPQVVVGFEPPQMYILWLSV